MLEAQELYCHACNKYVQFSLDLSTNGNYGLNCPSCGHVHYRSVINGRITGRRWGTSNAICISTMGTTTTSTFDTCLTGSTFTYQAWMNLTANS